MNLVVFDIDGTLIRYQPNGNDRAFIQALLETFGFVVEDHWAPYANTTDSGILGEIIRNRLGKSVSPSDVVRFNASMARWLEREYAAEPFSANDGAKEAWEKLANHPLWKRAVATGNWGFSGRYKLASAGFDLSDCPLSSADDGEAREAILESIVHRSRQQYGVTKFDKVVYVGDMPWDAKAARGMKWKFIGVATGKGAEALQKAGAEHILPDLKGLLPELERIQADKSW